MRTRLHKATRLMRECIGGAGLRASANYLRRTPWTQKSALPLVDYVNDRLDDSQRKTVEALLKGDPEARAEYEILTMVVDSLAQIPRRRAGPRLRRTDDQNSRGHFDKTGRRQAVRICLKNRVGTRGPVSGQMPLAGPAPQPVLRRRGASIFAVQFAVLAVLYRTPADQADYSAVRTRPTVPPVAGPFIRVSYKPEAKESTSAFPISVGATIVGGPTQLGDYYLYVQPERADWAAQKIGKSPIVDQANVMATLPPLKD